MIAGLGLPRATAAAVGGAAGFAGAAALADAGALEFARLVLCGSAVGLAAAVDIAERRVPNAVVVPAIVACAALGVADRRSLAGIAAGAALAAIFVVATLVAPAAVGAGDAKLAILVVVGLWEEGAGALVLGTAFGAVAGVVALLAPRRSGPRTLPYAPFLAGGAAAAAYL